MQFDKGYKGFSFSKEGPLDMRMDPSSSLTAEEIVNEWPEAKLGEIFREYGEETRWRAAARGIVQARRSAPIRTTLQLAEVIKASVGPRSKKKLHPATLIFQALRMCVNGELESVRTGITKAIQALTSGGRMGVISFHRLEDRIVKHIFKVAALEKKKEQIKPLLRLLTKKPLVPTAAEIRANIRSRSAKMRFAEKL